MNVAGVASRRASWIFCRLSCSIYAALRCFDFYAIAERTFMTLSNTQPIVGDNNLAGFRYRNPNRSKNVTLGALSLILLVFYDIIQ